MRPVVPVLLALLSAACSASPLKGSVYADDGLSFRVGDVPPSWKRLDEHGARLAFRDEQGEASVLLNARCRNADDDVPLAALTRHLFMTFTEREIVEQKTVPLDGREALHTILRAKLDGVPKAFDVYVLKKDGCVYDFALVSAPGTFDANRTLFERFVAGFRTLSEGG
jgi:hypothetical protein